MSQPPATPFNVVIIAQAGRLQYEAVIFAASFRDANPDFSGRLIVAEPQPGPLWPQDPRISDSGVRDLLLALGAEILSFENHVFGASYPHGNKIEALLALPEDVPFVFFDTDTLILGPLSDVGFIFDHPAASARCSGSWPVPTLYGPGHGQIWAALYDRLGLDITPTLDLRFAEDDWRRYLYFNAGWFFHSCPQRFGARFLDFARQIRDDPPLALLGQSQDPWLDQIALPLVIHSFGGGRAGDELAGLDGAISCHYRFLPLLYARESDAAVEILENLARRQPIKKVLRGSNAVRKMVYQGKGAVLRALFDRECLPASERVLRQQIKQAGLWLR